MAIISLPINIKNHTNKDVLYIHIVNLLLAKLDNDNSNIAKVFIEKLLEKYGKKIMAERPHMRGPTHLLFPRKHSIHIDIYEKEMFTAYGQLYIVGSISGTKLNGSIVIYIINCAPI